MFAAALHAITKIWKQPKCPSVDEWVKQLRDVYTVEHHVAINKEGNLSLCDSTDGPAEHYAQCNKPVGGRQGPCDLTCL